MIEVSDYDAGKVLTHEESGVGDELWLAVLQDLKREEELHDGVELRVGEHNGPVAFRWISFFKKSVTENRERINH